MTRFSTIVAATTATTFLSLIAAGAATDAERTDDAMERQTRAAVDRVNAAINAHDLAALMQSMTEDCVFENTNPAPDGTRYVGQAAVRAFWETWFASNPGARFEAEEMVVSGDRATVRWVYRKMRDGKPWHLRGIDLFKVRDGKVAEKLSYVKG